VECSQITAEWTSLKTSFYNKNDWEKKLEKVTWMELNREFRDMCPNVLSLVDLVLTLPASTSECERGFSSMKQIKSDWRSSLKSSTLSDLMTVKLHSAAIEQYDPTAAVEMWASAGPRKRNLTYKRNNTSTATTSKEESDDCPTFQLLEEEGDEEEEEEEFQCLCVPSYELDSAHCPSAAADMFWS